ncbi:YbdD/YjiX family protein [Variovorax sp. J2P1-59]|uniref:YbdD/YjiX family protein n=1 Tax=Variovorax flavidus TaxID=3053501 RepID=UPI002578187C|nr:YbdD/YjiX family protein [Variovorax sp. J2P1-59]MDM0073603.1 YbdD/YjiX family protein [Variovorax sp. J2P1-59]
MNDEREAGAQRWLGQNIRSLCSACRQVFGMPDYERYLAHAAGLHPGAPVLSRSEYCARVIERRYGKGGARCC